MAQEQKLKLKPAANGKRKLFIILAAVLVLAGGGIGGWLLLSNQDTASTQAPANAGSKASAGDGALYVGMPRAFVFNAIGRPRDRLVQIKVQLMVRGSGDEELAKLHTPLIEGTLLRVFSSATPQQLGTVAGKEKLRKDGLEEVRRVLTELTAKPVVEQLLFTGFVMQ